MLENIVNASGKLGGVAGVFAGVINCKKNDFKLETKNISKMINVSITVDLPKNLSYS